MGAAFINIHRLIDLQAFIFIDHSDCMNSTERDPSHNRGQPPLISRWQTEFVGIGFHHYCMVDYIIKVWYWRHYNVDLPQGINLIIVQMKYIYDSCDWLL